MAILFKEDGTTETVEIKSLQDMQKAVGGLIEEVRIDGDYTLLINEEGILLGLPRNRVFPYLFGPVLLVKVPEEFS